MPWLAPGQEPSPWLPPHWWPAEAQASGTDPARHPDPDETVFAIDGPDPGETAFELT